MVLSSCGKAGQTGNVVLPSSVNHVWCKFIAILVTFITSIALKKFVHEWALGVINLNLPKCLFITKLISGEINLRSVLNFLAC